LMIQQELIVCFAIDNRIQIKIRELIGRTGSE
jgi:hypothetical protein